MKIKRRGRSETIRSWLRREEVLTGPHAVETNKPHDPVHVRSLGVNGVVVQTEHLSDLIEEFGLLTFCRVRHIRLP